MPEKGKQIITTAVVAVGLGLVYMLARYNKKILNSIKTALDTQNSLRYQQIEVVNTVDECQLLIEKLKSHCAEYKVLGFDCEWVTVGGSRRPVALLQLASHQGLCGLFRLSHMHRVPQALKDLLVDESILKVGVAPIDDARYLSNDFSVGVVGTFDLRYLANYVDCKPEGLARMSQSLLNVTLDKNWRTRCSDWEAPTLTSSQQQYAANDAHVAIEIFKKLVSKLSAKGKCNNKHSDFEDTIEFCKHFSDLKFKNKSSGVVDNKKEGRFLDNTRHSPGKPYRREFSTRKSVLYHNCYLQAPDGEVLCTCDRKKAEWYIEKELGIKVSDEPLTVRLKFEPSGRAVGAVGQYYVQVKVNQCVVCGSKDSYIRKNVVPREYRKLFPVVMKEHTSHDVLLLCTPCHQRSNFNDIAMRQQLSVICDAPVASTNSCKSLFAKDQATLKSAARALLNKKANIPEARREMLQNIVLNFYPDETKVTEEILMAASSVSTTLLNENYEPHCRKVVDHFSKNADSGGLTQLERLWREHFLLTMTPQFMPQLWSISHNANRLEIRANEGRVDAADLIIAGVDHPMIVPVFVPDNSCIC